MAQGEVTYKGIQTFGEEDEGKFRVTKKLDNDGSEYYEIYIKYHGEESWVSCASSEIEFYVLADYSRACSSRVCKTNVS